MRRIALGLLATVMLGGAAPNVATSEISRMDTPWWRERFEAKQAELARRPPELVWLGDSITQDWELDGPEEWRRFAPIWAHYYGGRDAVDLGFKGDSTCHVLWRLAHGELASMGRPKAIVLLIGANNFGHVHTDAGETFAGIEKIVGLLRGRMPTTSILVIGVLPSIRSPWVTAQTRALNARLAEAYPAGGKTAFVDASGIFEADGRVVADRFLDVHLVPPDPPLHPTAQSQARIAALIEPLIEAAGFAPVPPLPR